MGILKHLYKQDKRPDTKNILSPLTGDIVPLDAVNDPLFSNKVLGDGVAILPKDGVLVAPLDGEIKMLFESKHAMLIKGHNGVKVFIHIGIDTVALGGKYYKSFCKLGDWVSKGDKLMEFDISGIQSAGYDMVTPVIVSNSAEYTEVNKAKEGEIFQMDVIISLK